MAAQGEMEFPGIYLPVYVKFGSFLKDLFLRPNFNQERASSRDYPKKGVTPKIPSLSALSIVLVFTEHRKDALAAVPLLISCSKFYDIRHKVH